MNVTVREFESRDLPRLLELLIAQDDTAEMRTMGPEGRSIEELALEFGELSPYSEMLPLVVSEGGNLTGYAALCVHDEETFIEGPILAENISVAAAQSLMQELVVAAQESGFDHLEAFVDDANTRAQTILNACGFDAFRTTYIYEFEQGFKLSAEPPHAFRIIKDDQVDVSRYRNLYRDTTDDWATRLAWPDEDLEARFDDPAVSLFLAYDGEELVGHLELEHIPEENYAEIAYFGVLPSVRGNDLGRILLLHALHDTFRDKSIEVILARAHDDERPAAITLEKVGFRLSHGVVAYTLDLTGDDNSLESFYSVPADA